MMAMFIFVLFRYSYNVTLVAKRWRTFCCNFKLHLMNSKFNIFREPNKKVQNSVSDNMMMDSENSVMASFDFLSSDNVVDDEEENMR